MVKLFINKLSKVTKLSNPRNSPVSKLTNITN